MEKYLQLISDYNLTKDQAFALRLMFIYIETVNKYIPEMPIKYVFAQDPRKYEIWKYCNKMYNEVKEKLQDDEYRLFIEAQILVSIRMSQSQVIHPSVITGEAAWDRWLIWKKNFIKAKKAQLIQPTDYKIVDAKEIMKELKQTHYALVKRLKEITPQNLDDNMALIIRLWNMGVVSPFFISLNPNTLKYLRDKNIEFNSYGYRKHMTDEVIKYYKELFKD